MLFQDRRDAGRVLAERLRERGAELAAHAPVVLAGSLLFNSLVATCARWA